MNELINGDKPHSPRNINTAQPHVDPGYYIIKQDHEVDYYREKGFVAGELAYVIPGKGGIHVIIGESEWTYGEEDIDEFYETFEIDPNGADKRQAEVAKLMQEVINGSDNQQINRQFLDFHPHVDGDSLATDSTGLIPTNKSIQDIKKGFAEARNLVLLTHRNLKVKTKRLSMLLAEQTRALALKASEFEAMVKRAEEAIWTINLYLGKNEEIHHLVVGKPAPAEEKIAIRQMVLFMDEECALIPRHGGIDAEMIDEFDKWLTSDQAHIQQIIPESKGIVALHIKRYRKEYEDPWTNISMNQANIHWTYFLIRNGENIYRVFVDIVLGENLFPTENEYNELFTATNINTSGHEHTVEYLKPGSKEYMRAMEAADTKHKHYLRIVLILQGLLDRTPIFKPMPVERINICDINSCDEYIRLIYDNENVLGDGRQSFSKWRTEINSQLNIGHRIIGIFDYASKLYGGDYSESRIYPKTACYPSSRELHTIEDYTKGKEGDALIIRYERKGDIIYPKSWREHSHAANTRARCILYRDDDFILNFDAAKVDDIQYYLTSRLSRHEYRNMIPVLEIALKLKQQEKADEDPFRLLLVGQIMKRFGAPREEVESRIDELINWWKFKNRTHRALTSDDTKALNMIVTEYGQRLKQESVRNRAALFNEQIVTSILTANSGLETILIAHKSGNKYVAYVAQNSMNVWVLEQIWSHNKATNETVLMDSVDWKLVDKRHMRWEIIYKSDRWSKWCINPKMSQVLTDAELEQAVQFALNCKWAHRQSKDKNGRYLPLCAHYDDNFKIKFWYSDCEPIIPTELIISTKNDKPGIAYIEVEWERKKTGIVFNVTYPTGYCYNPSEVPWKRATRPVHIIKTWDDNITKVADEFTQHDKLEEAVIQLENKYDYVVEMVIQQMYDEKVAIARREFDSEYGEPDLWEDHLKSLKIYKDRPHSLQKVLEAHAERGIDVVGKTLEQVYEAAMKMVDEISIPDGIPLEFVIPNQPDDINDDE